MCFPRKKSLAAGELSGRSIPRTDFLLHAWMNIGWCRWYRKEKEKKKRHDMLAFPHHPIKIKISQTVSSILNFNNRDIEGINLNVIKLLNFCSGARWPCHFDLFLHKIERKRKIVINMSLLGTVHILVSCRPCDGEMNTYRQFWRMYHLLKLSLFT